MKRAAPSPALLMWSTYIWPVVAFLLVTLLLPLAIPLLLIVRAYRHWLIHKIRHLCPEVQVAQQTDAMWFQNTKENLGVINSMWWVSGRPDVEHWCDFLDRNMVSIKDLNGQFIYPKLRASVQTIWHRYVWCPIEDFDIQDYVSLHKDTPKTQQEIDILLGYLCSTPLPQNKAQWQIILIRIGKPEEEKYVCVFRVHHAIGDGVSLMKMIMSHFFINDNSTEKAPVETPKGFGTKNQLLMILKGIFMTPAIQITRMFDGFDKNALHGPALSGHKLAAYSEQIDLELIKKMKNAAKCTVNDVLMACLAGAFQEYFKRNASYTPSEIKASIPINLRKPTQDHVLDNQFSLVFLGLPLREAGLRETLAETKRRMDAVKKSPEPLINMWTMSYVMARLPSWASKIVFDMITDQASMVVSNVPGPQHQLVVHNGQPIEKAVFWPPQRSKVGMAVSLLSYQGSVTMGLIVDKMLLSNPRVLVNLFEDKVYALAEDLGVADDKVKLQNGTASSEC